MLGARSSSYSGSDDWKSIQQRVPIRLTACHLGGVRPWYVCSVYSDGLLRTTSGHPLLRWRAICVPPVLWLVLCEPTADRFASWLGASAEGQDEAPRGGWDS